MDGNEPYEAKYIKRVCRQWNGAAHLDAHSIDNE